MDTELAQIVHSGLGMWQMIAKGNPCGTLMVLLPHTEPQGDRAESQPPILLTWKRSLSEGRRSVHSQPEPAEGSYHYGALVALWLSLSLAIPPTFLL